MLKNQTQVPLPDEYSTIISTIPVNPDVLSGRPLTVLVQWENGTPAYFAKYKDNYERISAPDLLTAINTRLLLSYAWLVFASGVISTALAFIVLGETAIHYLLIWFFLSCMVALGTHAMGRKKRRITINYDYTEESRLASAKLDAALVELGKVAQVWDSSDRKNLSIKSTAFPKISCNVPAISFLGLHPKIFWMPDQLYILTGRTYQMYSYNQLSIESSTYRTQQDGKLPPDAQILSQRWLHQRKDGQADQRYRENYQISQVEYGALHFSTATETLFKLGISNCDTVKQIAEAFRALAQSKPPVAIQEVSSLPSTPPPTPPFPAVNNQQRQSSSVHPCIPLGAGDFYVVNNQQHQSSSAQQENVKDVIYPLTVSSKEVLYPLTASCETKEEPIARNDNKQFLQDAQKYYAQTGKPCEAVGFITYWPTYASLNERQMRWYFYWRAEARKGHYLPTDTSYLFLHAYEVLNLVEKKDPIEAAGYLKILLAIYEKGNKEINRYFPEWSGDLIAEKISVKNALARGDLIAEKIGIENALAFWSKLKGKAYFSADLINAMVQRAANKNELPKLPWAIWYRLTDFRPNNKRLQAHFAAEQIVETHLRAIALADVYWRKKAGKSVVEQFTKGEPREIQKPLFRSAIIGRSQQQTISLGWALDYVGNQELSKHLASVMKEAENVLLKRAGITSGLLTTDLDSELKEIINRFLQPAPNERKTSLLPVPDKKISIPPQSPTDSPRIKIDLARVEELQRESENLSQLLGDASDEVQEQPVKGDWRFSPLIKTNHRPAQDDPTTRNFENTPLPQREQRTPVSSPFLELNLARVNELQRESGEISELLTPEDEWQNPSANKEPMAGLQAETLPEASSPADEWGRLFVRLTQAEKELLKNFAESGRLSEKRIEAIGRKYRAMALIDDLCEKAFEIFERDLVFSEGDHWAMEDDDIETLRLKLKEIEQT